MNKMIFWIVNLLVLLCIVRMPIVGQNDNKKNNLTISKLTESYQNYLEAHDTINAISVLTDLGYIYSHRAKYALAYEHFWNALSMASAVNDSTLLARIYNEIGWLYSYYKRNDESLLYYNKSLDIHKKLVVKNEKYLRALISDYYSLATLFREMDLPILSKQYLDSCVCVFNKTEAPKDDSYIQAEIGYYYLGQKNFNKTIDILKDIEPWFIANNPSYLIILHKFLGDAYVGIGDFTKSELLYKSAISQADSSLYHANYVPALHENLAQLYNRLGKYDKAYEQLRIAKQIENKLFDSRGLNNKSLLEILDKYKEEQKLRKELIQKQEITRLESEKRAIFYRNIALIITIALLLTFGVWGYYSMKLRARLERINAHRRHHFEKAKDFEIIELKNKELTLSTLRLIEKDKQLNQLKDDVCNSDRNLTKNELAKIFHSVSVDHNKNWKEFESRFIAINSQFYKALIDEFPNLTSNEIKLCSLIKLNFSGKEIANLLGIGLESVHTLRHRLRKKMGLIRDENLTQFLNSLNPH